MTVPPEPPEPTPGPPEGPPWGATPPGSPPPGYPPPGYQPSYPPPEPGGTYDKTRLGVAAVITVVIIAGATAVFPLITFAVPFVLIIAGIGLPVSSSRGTKSAWLGVLIGSAIGLIVSAGICIAVLTTSW